MHALIGEQIRPDMSSCTSAPRAFLQPQLRPHRVNLRLGRAVDLDHGRPVTVEAFGLPLARGVHSHLRSVVGQARSVIERIDGS